MDKDSTRFHFLAECFSHLSILAFLMLSSQQGLAQPFTNGIETSCENLDQAESISTESRQYFEALLGRGLISPLNDFLVLWSEDDATRSTENYFEKCVDKKSYRRPIRNDGKFIVKECAPDVLYSWGPEKKIKNMELTISEGGSWRGDPNPGYGEIFTTLSPFSTYNYGSVQIRIKIKPGVRFNVEGILDGGIGTFSGYNLDEYYVASSDNIEAWSYGTPEQYDEIVKDIRRFLSGKPFIKYWMSDRPEEKDPFKKITGSRDKPAGEDILKGHLLTLIEMILRGQGKIHYAPGVCHNRKQFFSTDRPTYFKGK